MQEGMICCVMVVSEGYRRVQVDHLDNCVTRQQVMATLIVMVPLLHAFIRTTFPPLHPSTPPPSSLFHRSTPPPPMQASVVFIDTGLSQMVACSQLYSLPPALSLLNVPPLAMPCRLGGVQSTFAGGNWYFLDNQQLWKHLMEKKVCPHICSHNVLGLNFIDIRTYPPCEPASLPLL